jgi:hypothetical protein
LKKEHLSNFILKCKKRQNFDKKQKNLEILELKINQWTFKKCNFYRLRVQKAIHIAYIVEMKMKTIYHYVYISMENIFLNH